MEDITKYFYSGKIPKYETVLLFQRFLTIETFYKLLQTTKFILHQFKRVVFTLIIRDE